MCVRVLLENNESMIVSHHKVLAWSNAMKENPPVNI